MRPGIRALLIMALVSSIAACGTDAGWQNLRLVVTERFSGPPELPLTRKEISENPYAMIMARFGRDQPAVLVLVADEARGQQWMASNNASIVIRKGRLVRTVGLAIDLADTFLKEGADPLAHNPQSLAGVVHYERFIELAGTPPRLSVLDCRMTPKGQEAITIIEIDFQVIRLEEKCKTRGWKFKNTYWVDPFDGFVWQSIEHIADGMQALQISVLKPAG